MPDYQDIEQSPAYQAMLEEEELNNSIEAAIAQQQQELQTEEQAQTPVPTSTPEPTQEEEEDEGLKDIWGRPWPRPQEEVAAESQQIAQDVVTGVGDTVLGIGELAEKY